MCIVLLSPAVNHIALNKYINIHGTNSAKTILQHLKFGEVDLNSPKANMEKQTVHTQHREMIIRYIQIHFQKYYFIHIL